MKPLSIRKSLSAILAIATCVCTSHSFAIADEIIGNLPGDTSEATLGTIITGAEGRSKAIGFTIGSHDYILEEATFMMQFEGDAAEVGAIPQVALWSDNAGNPGSQIAVLDNPGTLGALGFYTFTASTELLLSANTTYWVLVNGAPTNTDPNADAFYWNANTTAITHTGSAALVGYRFSATDTPPTGNSGVFNNVQINGSLAIPEPASLGLLMVGLGIVSTLRRRS